MTAFQVFKLYFTGSLHLSDVRQDYGNSEKIAHSDMLTAALIAAMARIGDTVPAAGKLPFALSSLFPFREEQGGFTQYFFPKPALRFNTPPADKLAKKLKKLAWLDQGYLEDMIHFRQIERFGEGNAHLQGEFLSRTTIEAPIYTAQTIPRVQVPRMSMNEQNEVNTTEIFYMQMLRFREGAGLYFIAQGDTTALNWLCRALDILGEEGIGTDRNVGNGQFYYRSDTLELNLPAPGSYMTNLSLFCPESPEQLRQLIPADDSFRGSYDLVKRGGWITSDGALGIRKKPVYMLREGSVLVHPDAAETIPQMGLANVDLTPDTLPPGRLLSHPIYRSGRALFIPVNL
ncbi:MAG TPA: type III-A CRISPR-associated RAMP protein Csm4 [Saprospiraceae bacterium]|nr:type III-A CRISPR-associated RAMP protein Csm4 [Saprospiraceae bacterium]